MSTCNCFLNALLFSHVDRSPEGTFDEIFLVGILHDNSAALDLDCMNCSHTGCSYVYSYTCLVFFK